MKKNLFCLISLFLLIGDLKGQQIEKKYVKDLSTYLIKKWGGKENPILVDKGSNMYLHRLSLSCNPNLKNNLQYEVVCLSLDKSKGNNMKAVIINISKYKTSNDARKAYTLYNKLSESFKPEVAQENQCTFPEEFMDGFWLNNNYLVLVQPHGYTWEDWIKIKTLLQKRFKNRA